MNLDELLALRVVETRHVAVDRWVLLDGAVYMHPLDVLRVWRPELSPVERVMVLVDRIVDAALRRLDS